MATLAAKIDHTNLKSTATAADIRLLCAQAKLWQTASVCVHPLWVALAAEELKGSSVAVCTVVGFPLGANTSQIKAMEAAEAVKNGAAEVDMVQNIGWAKEGRWADVEADIRQVVEAAKPALVKVILECCDLTKEEIRQAALCVVRAGADFVKTSTGFSTGGATVEDVKLLKEVVAGRCQIKAAGGIRSYETAKAMVEAGADRLGASATETIIKEETEAARK